MCTGFFTCPPDIEGKYMLVLPEIKLVPGSRTSDFFTPGFSFFFFKKGPSQFMSFHIKFSLFQRAFSKFLQIKPYH